MRSVSITFLGFVIQMEIRFTFVALLLSAAGWGQQDMPEPPEPAIATASALAPLKTSIVITATPLEPATDRRNSEVFSRTLFLRDDQISRRWMPASTPASMKVAVRVSKCTASASTWTRAASAAARAYGTEAKASMQLTHHWSLNAGVTKVSNAFYRGGSTRVYVDSAPHFTANAEVTVGGWKGWSGSLRMRAINHYRLDGEDASIVASGHTVFDATLSKRLLRGIEGNLAFDNLTNRDFYETQNYFESRLPGQDPAYRIHGTPGYPLTATVGLTFRLKGK